MAQAAGKQTRADQLYNQMRADIFAARLEPGRRLKFPDLCVEYETSVGVAREVLARLAAERLVTAQAHQGYAVIQLSASELIDLTTARVEIESLTFRQSVLHGSAEWEAEALASHHLLARLGLSGADATDELREAWYVAHEKFHLALLKGCPSRRILDFAISLREEAELYRRWAVPLGGEETRDVEAEHRAMLDAALARDADEASTLLRAHIATTSDILLAGSHASAPEPS